MGFGYKILPSGLVFFTVFFLVYSCHRKSEEDPDFGYEINGGGCSQTIHFTRHALAADIPANIKSIYKSCSKLALHWDNAKASFESDGIKVERVTDFKDNSEVYRITAPKEKKSLYDKTMNELISHLNEDPMSIESHTQFCLNNYKPSTDCPDCVNDLISVHVYYVHDAPHPKGISYNCMAPNYGCNIQVDSCATGKSYAYPAWWNGLSYDYDYINDIFKDSCKQELAVQDGYLVFQEPVLSCLVNKLGSDIEEEDPFLEEKILTHLCSEESRPSLYTFTREKVLNDDEYIIKYYDENKVEIEAPINIEDYHTDVWNVKKLKLEHPKGYWKVLDKSVDQVLPLVIPQGGYRCSFE